jgi:hypothetical protein
MFFEERKKGKVIPREAYFSARRFFSSVMISTGLGSIPRNTAR